MKFAGVAKIGADGKAELPVDKNATYVVAIDAESKHPGDFPNDGSLDARDVTSLMGRS